jgi:hypothetical protein
VTSTDTSGSPAWSTKLAITLSTGFPVTGVLDNFNRANGIIGSNWSGSTADYAISTNQPDPGTNGASNGIYWNASSFGADQEAYITFTQVDADGEEQDLLLKSQSNTSWGDGVIEVLYDAVNHKVQVWTYEFSQDWVQHGTDISVTFNAGDTFGARAKADGTVEVYKNGTLLASRNITGWSYYAQGGYIGLWFINAGDAMLDNFGGGTAQASGGEGLMSESSQSSMLIESTSSIDPFNMTASDASPFWQGLTFGASQPSQVTFTNVLGATSKPRSNGVWDAGTVQVLYDLSHQRIQLWRYDSQQGWIQSGADISVTFANGDVLSARARIDGTVEIYRNGTLLTTRMVSYNTSKLSLDQPNPISQNNGFFQPVAFQPKFNLPSMPLVQQQSSTVTIDYVYDKLKRLTQANYSNGDYYHYTYDAVGNRLSQVAHIAGNTTTTAYVYDHANRLLSVDGVLYSYDDNGNLLNDGANTTYTILGAWEGDPEKHIISYKTALGAALVGKKPGDIVRVKAGGNEDDYTLVGISRYADRATN